MTVPDTDRAADSSTGKPGPVGVTAAATSQPPGKPVIPAKFFAKAKQNNIHLSPAVLDAAARDGDDLLRSLRTAPEGLTQSEAESRAQTVGPNEVAQERPRGWFIRLLIILRNPLVVLLAVLRCRIQHRGRYMDVVLLRLGEDICRNYRLAVRLRSRCWAGFSGGCVCRAIRVWNRHRWFRRYLSEL